ncbi:hypothetical protein ASE74_01780 [Pedobacter sp. Leaf216]|nr:hypothetical protein ASE74_01780 [Pedobacter sp. Leaf216]
MSISLFEEKCCVVIIKFSRSIYWAEIFLIEKSLNRFKDLTRCFGRKDDLSNRMFFKKNAIMIQFPGNNR